MPDTGCPKSVSLSIDAVVNGIARRFRPVERPLGQQKMYSPTSLPAAN